MTVTAAHAPIRDRATGITYLQFAATSCFMFAFGASQALLRDEQGTTRTISGLHSTALALGGLIGALIAGRILGPVGRGRVIRFSMVALIIGLLIFTIPGARPWQSMLGIFLFSVFATIFIVGANAFLLDHQGAAGPASITEANAFASGGGLGGPVVIGIGAATLLGWRSGVWAIVLVLILLEALRGRNLAAYGLPAPRVPGATRPRLTADLFWSLVAIVCFVGTEFSLTFWAADLLREQGGLGPEAAAGLVAVFVIGMLIGRILGARLARSVDVSRLLIWSLTFSLAAFTVVWLGQTPEVLLIGLLLVGFGISLQWPLGLARAVEASGGQTDRASSLGSVAASIAIAIAPLALGLLSEGPGIRMAFLVVPALQLVALAVLVLKPVGGSRSR